MSTLESRLNTVRAEANKRRQSIDISISATGTWSFLLNGVWVCNAEDFEDGVTKLEARLGIEPVVEINREEEHAARWTRILKAASDKGRKVTISQANGRPCINLFDAYGVPRVLQGADQDATLALAEEALGIKS